MAGWRFHYSTESIWSLRLCVFCLYYDIFKNLGRVTSNNIISAISSLNKGFFLCSPFALFLHHWQQIMRNSHQTNAVGLEDLTFSPSKCHVYRNIVRLRNIFKAQEDRLLLLMSSKPTQTHTPSFTIISRMQCWLYSIRVQIIMSHFFHIKKKSIIISIVLVKFLTIVRWMYKILSERGHKIKVRA